MARNKITLQDLADSIRKNGLRQTFGKEWATTDDIEIYSDEEGKRVKRSDIGRACAIGQARINLHFMDLDRWSSFWNQIDQAIPGIGSYIIELNDNRRYNFAEIADHIEKDYDFRLDTVIWERK